MTMKKTKEKWEVVTTSRYENNVFTGTFDSLEEAEKAIEAFYKSGGRHDDPYAEFVAVKVEAKKKV